jgi:Signal transduction histidine kinase regulating C4-dicarboxylate transport system
MRLKPKTILSLAIPVAAGMLALSLSIGVTVWRDSERLYLQMMDAVVEARAAEIGRWAQSQLRAIRMNALSPEFRSGDIGRIWPMLRSQQPSLDPDQYDESFVTLEGRYYNSVGHTGLIPDREYVKAILGGKVESFVTDGLVSRDDGSYLILFAVVVRGRGERIVGLASTTTSLATVSKIAASTRIGEGYGSILDGRLTVIAHPNPDYVMKLNIADPALAGFRGLEAAVAMMRAGQRGHKSYADMMGVDKYLSFAPVPHTAWTMAVAVPASQVHASAYGIMWLLVALSIGILVALIALIARGVDRIVRPVRLLSGAASAVTEDRASLDSLASFAEIRSDDELGALARSFSSMAGRLGRALDSLRSLNADLESRVEERTNSLESSNRELANAVAELQAAQEKAEIAAKTALLGRLMANLANELNTPLAAILASASTAGRELEMIALSDLPECLGLDQPRAKTFADALLGAFQEARSLDLSEDAALSLAVAGRLRDSGFGALVGLASSLAELARSQELVLEAADKAASTLKALAHYAGIDSPGAAESIYPARDLAALVKTERARGGRALCFSLDLAADEAVRGDREALGHVWSNLVENAIQAMGRKGRLAIASRREAGELVLSFTDSGPGIAEPNQAKIFTPFFTTKSPGEGAGLGLEICKRIVEMHGGSIGFESRPGTTTFWVRLPLESVEELRA